MSFRYCLVDDDLVVETQVCLLKKCAYFWLVHTSLAYSDNVIPENDHAEEQRTVHDFGTMHYTVTDEQTERHRQRERERELA